MTELTSQGLIRTRLDERIAEINTKLQAIFGPDISLDPDTVDGQTVSIFAELISNLDQLAEDIYHSFNPQSSTRAALSRLVQLNGIRRIAGSYSVCDVTCVGQQGTIIPAGSLVKSTATNAQFATLAQVTIGSSGEVVVATRAVVMGAVAAPAGTLTKIDTPIYGWQTATNVNDATLGRNEETDEQLRLRRRLSTATPAQAVLDAMTGALLNIPSVLQAKVYENPEDEVDANGLPAHSMYCVVEGGTDQEIIDTIWLKKTSGVKLVGSITGSVLDSLGNPHTMRFDRPADVNVYVIVNLTKKTGWPTDGETRIKTAIVDWARDNQAIGEAVTQSQLYGPIHTVPGISVQSVYIGTAPAPSSTADITIDFNELARFASGRITVNAS